MSGTSEERAKPDSGVLDVEDVIRRATIAVRSFFPDGVVADLVRLTGGASSITFDGTLVGVADGPDRVVVKVAPPGLPPTRNRDVLRQARLLDVLWTIDGILTPRVFGRDAGSPPEIPPLFVMEHVPGSSYEPLRTVDGEVPSDDDLRERSASASRMLASLHAAVVARQVTDEPVTTLTDEIGRWSKALGTVDPSWVSEARRTEGQLMESVPEQGAPAVLHGDWRLGNMQCAGAEIRAVIDWEIWSVGDARFDVAWYCMMMDPSHPGVIVGREATPTSADLVGWYESVADRSVDCLPWFLAATAYKQAATSALIAKHALKRDQFGHKEERLVSLSGTLLEWAQDLLA